MIDAKRANEFALNTDKKDDVFLSSLFLIATEIINACYNGKTSVASKAVIDKNLSSCLSSHGYRVENNLISWSKITY